MAQITGLTAARMLDIEANSIVDGGVDVNGNLILTTHNGIEINAGSVVGPKGDDASTIITPKPAADLPSTYPLGVTTFSYGSGAAQGFPAVLGMVFTVIESVSRGFQIVTDKDTTNIWFRVVGQDSWGAFVQIATKDYVDGAISSAIAPLTTKTYVDNLVVPQELGGGVDLNTLTTNGTYVQSANAEAVSGLNYPQGLAGLLEVKSNGDSGMIWQKYTVYNTGTSGTANVSIWQRAYYVTAGWSAWFLVRYDTGWKNLTPASGWASSPTTTQKLAAVRRIGDIIRFRGVLSGTLTQATTTVVATVPSGYYNDWGSSFCGIGSTGGYIGWANVTDTGQFAVHFKSPYPTGAVTLEITGMSYTMN